MSDYDKRFFEVYEENGTYEVEGKTARHAAIAYVRSRIAPQDKQIRTEEQAKQNTSKVRLSEKGSDRVHIYRACFWHEDAPDSHPSWMGDTIAKVSLTKEGIEV